MLPVTGLFCSGNPVYVGKKVPEVETKTRTTEGAVPSDRLPGNIRLGHLARSHLSAPQPCEEQSGPLNL